MDWIYDVLIVGFGVVGGFVVVYFVLVGYDVLMFECDVELWIKFCGGGMVVLV